MTPWLDDGDVRLYHGDALEVLRGLPDGSVDCCVTSPPYWGLRDYGTGEWEGGDPDCDHVAKRGTPAASTGLGYPADGGPRRVAEGNTYNEGAFTSQYRDVCGKCGARRVDQQLGLEPTPDLFVQNMVNVFREVRRVLADHGTCWVNLGDSYAGSWGAQSRELSDGDDQGANGSSRNPSLSTNQIAAAPRKQSRTGAIPEGSGLKPKDLVGIPWRVAFALQADGWYLRSDIVWAKPNPMPESVTDRPTKSHEYVFLLTKRPRYFFDQEAVRERYVEGIDPRGFRHDNYVHDEHHPTRGRGPDGRKVTRVVGQDGSEQHRNGERWPNPSGRNVRSVWTIATQPYPEAHFATFPEELARRCIVAGCPERVCRECGKPSERIVERGELVPGPNHKNHKAAYTWSRPDARDRTALDASDMATARALAGHIPGHERKRISESWSDCGHNAYRPGVVLDPFMGSGTVAKVARDHARHSIGIDLNEQYLELAARRLQQLSLLNEAS